MSNKTNLTPKMLIVSNNVISYTRNNGKTILSFIEGYEKENIHQLYFNDEKPSVRGYSYYQLSDKDIVYGILKKEKRGRVLEVLDNTEGKLQPLSASFSIKRFSFFRIVRDILWKGHWKSPQLVQWLDEFVPDVVFFVAGDSGFSYDIVNYIVKRYRSRLVTYITDDYIMPRKNESFFDKIKRKRVRRKMLSCIEKSDEYFTISSIMQKTYQSLSGKCSEIIMNMTHSLYDSNINNEMMEKDKIVMVYTGSLYYGRDVVLGAVADAACEYNKSRRAEAKEIEIRVYSNVAPDATSRKKFERKDCCIYCGALTFDDLKRILNEADILLFVESFDEEMQEKTRYSLSTKVPEYMSVRKPIFAVGPVQIGSMDYLSDVAFCANSKEEIFNVLSAMLSDKSQRENKAKFALKKYNNNHNVEKQKNMFWDKCFGYKVIKNIAEP